jgi:hypothetical protein
MTNRVVRSTRVAICDTRSFPVIRSLSQKPRHGPVLGLGLGGTAADQHHLIGGIVFAQPSADLFRRLFLPHAGKHIIPQRRSPQYFSLFRATSLLRSALLSRERPVSFTAHRSD